MNFDLATLTHIVEIASIVLGACWFVFGLQRQIDGIMGELKHIHALLEALANVQVRLALLEQKNTNVQNQRRFQRENK